MVMLKTDGDDEAHILIELVFHEIDLSLVNPQWQKSSPR